MFADETQEAMTTSACPLCHAPMSGLATGRYCPRCTGRLLLDTALTEDEAGSRRSVGPCLGEYELGPELGRGAMGVVRWAWSIARGNRA